MEGSHEVGDEQMTKSIILLFKEYFKNLYQIAKVLYKLIWQKNFPK